MGDNICFEGVLHVRKIIHKLFFYPNLYGELIISDLLSETPLI